MLLQLTPSQVSSNQLAKPAALLFIAATMDGIGTTIFMDELARARVCVDDIGSQLVNVQSAQQMMAAQVSELEKNAIESTFNELKSLLPKLEAIQTSFHQVLDAHARSLSQKPWIIKLPDELLRMISELVRDNPDTVNDDDSIRDIKSIKSMRLTCRRLCDASSHLLLHQLDVSLTTSSLAHLDEVSRHPTISKGIRSLQICAALYDPGVARNFRSFTGNAARRMRQYLEDNSYKMSSYFDVNLPQRNWQDPQDGCNKETAWVLERVQLFQRRRDVALMCAKYLAAEESVPDEDQTMATFRRVYEQYRQLVSDQETLLRDDTFVQNVAMAVARMPTIVGLSMTDRSSFKQCSLSTSLSGPVDHTLRRDLFVTSGGNYKIPIGLQRRTAKLLYQLPLAIGRAGNSLTELYIGFDSEGANKGLELDKKQMRDIVRAVGHLKVLHISGQWGMPAMYSTASPGEWTSLPKFVSLFMRASSLRSVTIDLGNWYVPPEFVAPSLVSIPWEKLTKISLHGFSMDLDEIRKHIDKLQRGTCIVLWNLYLKSGSRADLLDMVREKADCQSDVFGLESHENDSDDENEDAYWSTVLNQTRKMKRLINGYIRGHCSENPFRQPPNLEGIHPDETHQDSESDTGQEDYTIEDGMDEDDTDGET